MKNLVYLAKVLHRLQLAGKLQQPQVAPRDEGRQEDEEMAVDRVRTFEQRTLLQDATSDSDHEEGEGSGEKEEGKEGARVKDLEWLMRRMSRLANYEAGHCPKESIKVCLGGGG